MTSSDTCKWHEREDGEGDDVINETMEGERGEDEHVKLDVCALLLLLLLLMSPLNV